MSFSDRLKEAKAKTGLSSAFIAKQLGVSIQSVHYWERGSIPKAGRLEALAELLGVPPEWLAYGSGASAPVSYKHEDGSVTVPYLRNIEVSAGGGRYGDTSPVIRLIDLDPQWLNETLPYASRTDLAILAVSGDSMIPTFCDKDTLLIDQSVRRITRDGLFVVTYDGMLFSKRFQVLPQHRLLMLSDNKLYKDVTINLEEDQINFQVVGRIIYHWHGEKH